MSDRLTRGFRRLAVLVGTLCGIGGFVIATNLPRPYPSVPCQRCIDARSIGFARMATTEELIGELQRRLQGTPKEQYIDELAKRYVAPAATHPFTLEELLREKERRRRARGGLSQEGLLAEKEHRRGAWKPMLFLTAVGFLIGWGLTRLIGWALCGFVHSDSPGGKETGEVAADDEE